MRSVCVFCGSSPGLNPAYLETARHLGRTLAASARRLVYGGGNVGLMGALATAVMDAGGTAVGVIPESLAAKELAHRGLTELRVVRTMHERKALMAELSDGFIAMPGGLGTLEEFFEVWTWGQLGLHHKPYGLLDIDGFFDPLLGLLDRLVEQRFVRAEHRHMLLVDTDPEHLLAAMDGHRVPTLPKWIDRDRT
jgi:uncharacterized protein (TIGR00730 family)